MKILLIILAVIVAIALAVIAIGAMLPQNHTASRSRVVRKELREVYAVIRDVAAAPQWRKELKRVEVLSPTQFREHGAHDAVTYDIVEDQPGRKIVTRIADKNLPYGGSWTYELEPAGGGTRVTITENGEVYNPFFRFVSRFVIGYTGTIEKYLAALEQRLT